MRVFHFFSAFLIFFAFTNLTLAKDFQPALPSCERYLSPQGGGYIDGYEGNPVGNAIDRFLSWFGIGTAPADRSSKVEVSESELYQSPLAQNMLKLARAGALLNQSDKRLHQFQLLVANGGLCVSTSVLNSLATICNPDPKQFQKLAPVLITLLVKIYPVLMKDNPLLRTLSLPPYQPGEEVLLTFLRPLLQNLTERFKDARYGTLSTSVFLRPLENLMLPYNIHFRLDQAPTLNTLIEASGRNSIMIVAASIRDRLSHQTAPRHGRHAMVLLKYLTATNEVVISDPNRPNQIFREKLEIDSQGRLFFRLRVNYTNNGSIAYLDEIQVIEGPSLNGLN